jgi:ATP-dependent Clp protease protease subunit
MAGSKIHIADNALVMVHHPYTISVGNAAEMRKMADTLDQIAEAIIATYRWHSELSEDEIRQLMDAETWMDADTAIANGFATEKVEGLQVAASIDARAMAKFKVPAEFKARVDALLVTKRRRRSSSSRRRPPRPTCCAVP